MTSYVENETNTEFPFDIEQLLVELMNAVLEREGCPYEAQVNLLLTDNQGIRQYNNEFRKIDSPTDVLSFPMIEFEREGDFSAAEEAEADCFEPETGELLLGDIVISVEKVKEQAIQFGHSEKREFAFLVTHSLLHLCGYDHMEPDEAEVMEKKQNEILNFLGITRDV
ncbi:MAG: rRNA maturation RNase YbeY [Lachnospiraceae bacterium]|nr:rRNA maturation RNase YbeY [Lachnospiraceae bacterium]